MDKSLKNTVKELGTISEYKADNTFYDSLGDRIQEQIERKSKNKKVYPILTRKYGLLFSIFIVLGFGYGYVFPLDFIKPNNYSGTEVSTIQNFDKTNEPSEGSDGYTTSNDTLSSGLAGEQVSQPGSRFKMITDGDGFESNNSLLANSTPTSSAASVRASSDIGTSIISGLLMSLFVLIVGSTLLILLWLRFRFTSNK